MGLLERGLDPYTASWPLHRDTAPSLVLYCEDPQDESFYCFGCQATGDVIEFVRLIEDCSFQEAVDVACIEGDGLTEHDFEMPEKGRTDELEVALLLVANTVRERWIDTKRSKRAALNKRVHRLCLRLRESEIPLEVAHRALRMKQSKWS